jgi:hypothetical protein
MKHGTGETEKPETERSELHSTRKKRMCFFSTFQCFSHNARRHPEPGFCTETLARTLRKTERVATNETSKRRPPAEKDQSARSSH